jgi:hypothetical protein
MALEAKYKDMTTICLDRKEAADVIGLLAAQLAKVALVGNARGAMPSINVVVNGQVKYRLVLYVEPEAIATQNKKES